MRLWSPTYAGVLFFRSHAKNESRDNIGIGTAVGLPMVTNVGVWLAGVVLWIAHRAAVFPQLGVTASIMVAVAGFLAVIAPRVRAAVVLGFVVAAVWIVAPHPPPAGPELTVLDVGQGDSILLRGSRGEVILVDGGPDPILLAAALRERSIRHVDLMVATHRHADHTTGLAGVASALTIDRLWHPGAPGVGEPLDDLIAEASAGGAVVETPQAGTAIEIGSFVIEVLGPMRRYASPNDGSIVLMVRAGGATALLSGDIETFAQADLGPLPADVMKVPHQGAATSDVEWLAASAPTLAIISVGPNDFGHPSENVIRVLEAAGADVRRTDRDGDVVVRLDRLVDAHPGVPLPSDP